MAKKDKDRPQKERSDISLGEVIDCDGKKKNNFRKIINPQKSLRARLCLCFCVTSLTFGICLLVTTIFSTNQLLIRENGKTLIAISQSAAERMTSSVYTIGSQLQGFVHFPVFQLNPTFGADIISNGTVSKHVSQTTWLRSIMRSMQASYPYYKEISYVLANGTVIVSTEPKTEGDFVGSKRWFLSSLDNPRDVYFGFPEPCPRHNTTVIHYSLTVINATSFAPLGVVIIFFDWKYARSLEDSVSVYQNLNLYIMDWDRHMLLGPNDTIYNPTTQVPLDFIDEFVNSPMMTWHYETEQFVDPHNSSQLTNNKLVVGMAKCTLLGNGNQTKWLVLMTLPSEEAMSLTIALRNKLILFSVIFWFVLSGIGWCIASQIVHPLTRTSQFADVLMRDNEKFNKAVSQEFDIPVEYPGYKFDGDQQMQDSILGILKNKRVAQNSYWKDEVYTLCRSTELLMHTLYHQRLLTLKLEQVVAERTKGLRDEVARRKEMQKAAEEAQRSAELAEAAKSRFLANMSHEIRTPMNGILGTLLLLLDTKLLGEQVDYVMTMKHCADSLLCIINDVLMYSKLEADKLQLDASIFQIEDVCEGVGKLLGPLAAAKSVDMYFLVDPAVPALCIGDPGRLRQVLINLVGNSVKFTDIGGEIVVVCSLSCTTCYLRKMFGSTESSPYQHGGGDHECCDQIITTTTNSSSNTPRATNSANTTPIQNIKQIASSSSANGSAAVVAATPSTSKSSSTSSAMTNNEEPIIMRIEKVEERISSSRLREESKRKSSSKLVEILESPKKKKGHKKAGSVDSARNGNGEVDENIFSKSLSQGEKRKVPTFDMPSEDYDLAKFRRHSTTSVGKFGRGFKIVIPNNNNGIPEELEIGSQKNKRSASLDGYAHINDSPSRTATHSSIECFKPGAVCNCKNKNINNNNNGETSTINNTIDSLSTNPVIVTEVTAEGAKEEKKIENDTQLIRFEVRDNGCGISKEQIGRLFTPFFQADNSTTRVKGGTGLGLSICKQLVELFGGTTNVQSTLNKGSSFSFTARFSSPPQPSPRSPPQPSPGPSPSPSVCPSPLPAASTPKEGDELNVSNVSNLNANYYESPPSSPASSIMIPSDECMSSGPSTPVSLSLSLSFPNSTAENDMLTPSTPFPYALSSPPPALLTPITPSQPSPRVPIAAMFSLSSSLPSIEKSEAMPTTPRSMLATGMRPPLPSPRALALSSSNPRLSTPPSQRVSPPPTTFPLPGSFTPPPPLNLKALIRPSSPSLPDNNYPHTDNNAPTRISAASHRSSTNLLQSLSQSTTPRLSLLRSSPRRLPATILPQIDISTPIRVLVASDKLTFLRVASQSLSSMKIANIIPVPTPESGKSLARTFASGDFSIGVIYNQNAEHLMINAKLILTYLRQRNRKPIPLIVVCSMAANSSVRKKLHSLGVTTIFTPIMCAKLNDTVLSVLAMNNIIKDENNQYKNSLPPVPTTPLTIPYVPALVVANPSQTPTATAQQVPAEISTAPASTEITEMVQPLQRISSSTAEKKNAMRVLAVEDNPINMKILKKYLERMETIVTFASDGLEAVEAVQSKPVAYFDLVFMDLHMPHMDGMQATAEIRKWEEEQYALQGEEYEKGVTIVALTADVLAGTEAACSSAGMDGYISKPIDYNQLLAKVEEVKSKSRRYRVGY